jgi:hypothetical protein
MALYAHGYINCDGKLITPGMVVEPSMLKGQDIGQLIREGKLIRAESRPDDIGEATVTRFPDDLPGQLEREAKQAAKQPTLSEEERQQAEEEGRLTKGLPQTEEE